MKHTLVITAMLSMLALSACEKKDTTVLPSTTVTPAPESNMAAPGNTAPSQMSPSTTTPPAMDSGAKPDSTTTPAPMTPPPEEKK